MPLHSVTFSRKKAGREAYEIIKCSAVRCVRNIRLDFDRASLNRDFMQAFKTRSFLTAAMHIYAGNAPAR